MLNNPENQVALPPFTPECRSSGVLLHVTSLPSPYGIGDVGPAAFAWVDRLHDAGQRWWQSLPLGPTGCGKVFCEALEITDPEQRRQFLDQACGTDEALRGRVEGLLALSPNAGDFFDECRPALKPWPTSTRFICGTDAIRT